MWLLGVAIGVVIAGTLFMVLRLLGTDFPFLLWQAIERRQDTEPLARAKKAGAS
jgi:hypothetical protein